MNCENFRDSLRGEGELSPSALAHMRECSDCLECAVSADPELLFRALGGEELVPPGGTDAFVETVVEQVHLREAERRFARRPSAPVYLRWAVAATLATGVIAAGILYRPAATPQLAPAPAIAKIAPAAQPLVSRPVIESYDSPDATIVELASADDLQVVMVFDETLPADL